MILEIKEEIVLYFYGGIVLCVLNSHSRRHQQQQS
jgi:hypothetical protein